MFFLRRALQRFVVGALTCLASSLGSALPGDPGTLDYLFGADGVVTTDIGPRPGNGVLNRRSQFTAVKVLQDGRILAAGKCWDGFFCLARYLPNGKPDLSFGTNGFAIDPVLSVTYLTNEVALAVQADGKYLLTAGCYIDSANRDFCTTRYNVNGSRDQGFGTGGAVVTLVSSSQGGSNAAAVQPDGKIVVAGQCSNGVHADFCLMRYLTDGSVDAQFGTDGRVRTTLSLLDDVPVGIAIQSDGKIVAGGACQAYRSEAALCAARYNTDGSLDNTFGNSGMWIEVGSGYLQNLAVSMRLTQDGKILVGGSCNENGDHKLCVVRLTSDGSVDPTFGSSGRVSTLVGIFGGTAHAVDLQLDGKILISADCGSATAPYSRLCVVRYTQDGALDSSFSADGIMTTDGSQLISGRAIALQADGKFIVAGSCPSLIGSNPVESDFNMCLTRYYAAPLIANAALDIDGSGMADASTDGLLIARYLLGFRGNALIANAVAPNATRSVGEIENYISLRVTGVSPSFKVSATPSTSATSDGLLIWRHLSGLTGQALVQGIPIAAPLGTANKVSEYLTTLPP